MTGFSNQWENEWNQRDKYPQWPWTDLVSAVHRHTDIGPDDRVLELGCGAGVNVPFFRELGVNYYSVEGSESAVNELLQKFPELDGNVAVGDFTANFPFIEDFDYVVDRASLATNSTAAIEDGLDLVAEALRPGGKIITIDMYSTEHSGYKRGPTEVDTYTRSGFEDGIFANLGEIHFCSGEHIRDLYGTRFDVAYLEHKVRTQVVPEDQYQHAAWDIVATKP